MSDGWIEQLEARSAGLAARIVEEMYDDPFWTERFGARGRKFAEQDGNYHVTYLVQALIARDPAVLTRYSRWLQTVLTTRGMCSLHLDQNFARLARAIADEIPEARLAVEYLEGARAALRYDAGAAREIQDAAEPLTASAAEELSRLYPSWTSESDAHGAAALRNDVIHLLSYLADAIALGRVELFTAHAAWMDDSLQRRGGARTVLMQTLGVLSQSVSRDRSVSHGARTVAVEMLGKALDRLAEKPLEPRPGGGSGPVT